MIEARVENKSVVVATVIEAFSAKRLVVVALVIVALLAINSQIFANTENQFVDVPFVIEAFSAKRFVEVELTVVALLAQRFWIFASLIEVEAIVPVPRVKLSAIRLTVKVFVAFIFVIFAISPKASSHLKWWINVEWISPGTVV